jgi:hypothetical protein
MLRFKLKKYPYIFILISGFILNFGHINAQSGISLYHMQGATFQGSHFNPAYMPEGQIFLGLPVLSGIAVSYNNRLNYNDIIGPSETGSGKAYNFNTIVGALKKRNYLSLESEISTFYMGIKPNPNNAISLFVRERISANVFFPKDLLSFALQGNKSVIEQDIDLSKLEIDVRYYREIGLGYWKHFPKSKLSFGVRLKYLTGIFNASTHNKFDGKVRTLEDNYQLAFEFQNATINTSGVDTFDKGSSTAISQRIIGNGNTGFGIDLGVNFEVSPELSFSLAVNDLGYINWKEDVKNFTVTDTTFSYGGLDLKETGDVENAITDSLRNRFNDVEDSVSYKTPLNTRIYGSVIYKLTDKDIFSATLANHGVLGRLRLLYSLGYTRKVGKVLTVSGNVIKHPQHGINLGLGTAVNLGAFQLYMATDRLLGYGDVTKLRGADFKFGINFIFGRGGNGSSGGGQNGKAGYTDDRSDLMHDNGSGKTPEGYKKDGIYWIIPKKKPRPAYEKRNFRDV